LSVPGTQTVVIYLVRRISNCEKENAGQHLIARKTQYVKDSVSRKPCANLVDPVPASSDQSVSSLERDQLGSFWVVVMVDFFRLLSVAKKTS